MSGWNGIGGNYPDGAGSLTFNPAGIPFPFSPAIAAPPVISPSNLATTDTLVVFDPNLKLPYSFEWNASVEQSLGRDQAFSLSYVGAAGRRLIQTELVSHPNLVNAQWIPSKTPVP